MYISVMTLIAAGLCEENTRNWCQQNSALFGLAHQSKAERKLEVPPVGI